MSQTVSRRSITSGVAWSLPAVAAVSAAPFAAASPVCSWDYIPSTYCPTDEDLRAGYFDPRLFGPVPDGTYSSTGGGPIPVTTAQNWGFKNTTGACGADGAYKGSVSGKFHNNTGEAYIPAPTLTLRDGTVYTGAATLGHVVSGGARVGFRASTSIRWEGSAGQSSKSWVGAVVRAPYEFSYTDSAGKLHVGMMELTYTLADYSNGLKAFTDLRSYATPATPPPPSTVCKKLGLTPA